MLLLCLATAYCYNDRSGVQTPQLHISLFCAWSDTGLGVLAFSKHFWYATCSNYFVHVKGAHARHEAWCSKCEWNSRFLFLTFFCFPSNPPHHLSLPCNFLIMSYFSTSLGSVFSAHVYADVDPFWLFFSFMLLLRKRREAWKRAVCAIIFVISFAGPRGESPVVFKETQITRAFFIQRLVKPLRRPFWTYNHSNYTNDFLGIWRKFIWRHTFLEQNSMSDAIFPDLCEKIFSSKAWGGQVLIKVI